MPRTGGPQERWPVGTARVVVEVARSLLDRLDELTDRAVRETARLEPSYAGGVVPADDLWRTVHDNMELILRRLAFESGAPAFDSLPAAIGRRRAEQGLALDALLHAFRVDFRVVWEAMVEVARREHPDRLEAFLDGATRVWTVIDDISTSVVEAYRDEASAIARRHELGRQALLDVLIDGHDPGIGSAADVARALDLPVDGPYLAVVSVPLDRPELALRPSGARSVWSRRADEDIAVVAVPPAGAAAVVAAMEAVATGPVGVSQPFVGVGEIAAAVRLARVVQRTRSEVGVVSIDDVLVETVVAAAPEAARVVAAIVLRRVLDQPAGARRRLLETARAFVDGDGSVADTARRLGVHRNTVLNRLARLEQLTGRSLREPRRLAEVVVALESLAAR